MIRDKVYGCLIGGAIGNALGAPTECTWFSDIREHYGRVDRFLPRHRLRHRRRAPPSTVTDDTTLRPLLCVPILRRNGRVTPDDFRTL